MVGRILAEEHGTIELQGSAVQLNGKHLGFDHRCSPATMSVPHPLTGKPVVLNCEFEQVSRTEFPRLRADNNEGSPVMHAEVAPGHVYLVSDDRYFHDDSRDFGSLPAASCNERVILRLWSARGWFDADRRLSAIP